VDITVYLPDEIGRWAKDEGLNLSALLREAVVSEQARRKALESMDVEEHELHLESDDGDYIGLLRGEQVGEPYGPSRRYSTYIAEDGRIFVYDDQKLALEQIADAEELRDVPEAYVALMHALGQTPRVSI
jgi:hypothetical protein